MSYDYKDIRNFYFENELGKRIDCQKVNGGLFLYNVSGLGYEEDIEYVQVGNTFVPNKKTLKQNQITGDLEFDDMSYDEYSDFIDFVLKSSDLKLIYIPKKTNRIEYYRDIDIVQIDKSEEDDYNILTSPITIKCKSLWYTKNETIYTIEPQTGEIRWDFAWDSRFNDYASRISNYINNGHVEAPILLEIDGFVVNPSIEVYIEGELYQTVTFDTTIEKYEKLLYCSKEEDFYINKQKVDGSIVSLFEADVIKFENDNVVRIPTNRSTEIRLLAANDILKAKITFLEYRKAV
ncbi:MAG: phage baseplate protein [Clostridia bacterium]|nr:phage baseplate protein [Clostridia bacterium]